MIVFELAPSLILPVVREVVGCALTRVMVVCVDRDSLEVDVLDEAHSGTFDSAALSARLCSELSAVAGAPLPSAGATVSVQVAALGEGFTEVRVSQPCA
ncbi:hypothetical protein [Rhodobacter sp. TJ_12]|uniref:hypothetical protein n=1 Tax=Rhodobacter sp. TJ_12 TaxID=2029399 RepID=UPI001CC104BB|nr:hypothetical protein [Rhodobacter sp. TJ_12]